MYKRQIRQQFSQTEHFHTPRLTRALSGYKHVRTPDTNLNRKRNLMSLWCLAVAALSVPVGSFLFATGIVHPSGPVFMFSALRIAPIVGAVAIIAHLMKSRAIFWWGTAGALSGPMVIYTQSTGRYFHTAEINAEQWQATGIFGAIICCSMVHGYRSITSQNSFQFSIRFLIIAMAIIALPLTIGGQIAG